MAPPALKGGVSTRVSFTMNFEVLSARPGAMASSPSCDGKTPSLPKFPFIGGVPAGVGGCFYDPAHLTGYGGFQNEVQPPTFWQGVE
ncbi:hypothetical protein AGMMS49545_09210 [Betaproteobacteria bacterium]|nr:hypothetical protein AGMMS49545_09210 [Betaproteobacteria bacterium]GHU44201.1 hypothetical protein AGMMS50289_11990 [Betaproteobacteria bacterium]